MHLAASGWRVMKVPRVPRGAVSAAPTTPRRRREGKSPPGASAGSEAVARRTCCKGAPSEARGTSALPQAARWRRAGGRVACACMCMRWRVPSGRGTAAGNERLLRIGRRH